MVKMTKNTDSIDIVVNLGGGLGNRLHTLYSCHYLTIKYGIPFSYCWRNDFDSNCKFDDIYDAQFINIVSRQETQNRLILNSNDILLKEHLNQKVFWISPHVARFESSPHNIDWQESFDSIPIKKSVVERINSARVPNDCIGLHVRGGDIKAKSNIDPADTRRYAEPEKFFPYIDQYIAINNSQQFYLSCEDYEDELVFMNKYPELLFLKLDQCVYNRNTVQGVIDGFINMMLLSKCNTIIGMISSFSGFASRINNKAKLLNL